MSADPIPLSPEDRAILDLESGAIVGHTCKVIVVGAGAPTIDALRERFAERLSAAPELTRKLGGPPQAPTWVVDPRFDLSAHVTVGATDAPLAANEVAGVAARLFAERLDRDRPLWKLDAFTLKDGGLALVWRIHHAIADGTTTMRLARAVLWDDSAEPVAGGRSPRDQARADDERRRSHLARFLRRETARSPGASPFDAAIGERRTVAFASAPLDDLHDAARRLAGATVNDGVLACVAGGLRRWLEAHHGELGELRAKVPVSLHHEGDHAGNRDSFFNVALPLSEPDPVARLAAVTAETALRKAEHDAEAMDATLRALGRASPRLRSFAERLERNPRRFALNVSNVPGPRAQQTLGGAPVTQLQAIAEIGERHALRVAVLSYAGRLYFGLCADPDLVEGLEVLAGGIEAEATALVVAAGP